MFFCLFFHLPHRKKMSARGTTPTGPPAQPPPQLLATAKADPEGDLQAQREAVIEWKRAEIAKRRQERSRLEKELSSKPRNLRRSIRRPKSFYNSDFISLDILSEYRGSADDMPENKVTINIKTEEPKEEEEEEEETKHKEKLEKLEKPARHQKTPKRTRGRGRQSRVGESEGEKIGEKTEETEALESTTITAAKIKTTSAAVAAKAEGWRSPKTPRVTDFTRPPSLSESSASSSEPQSPRQKPARNAKRLRRTSSRGRQLEATFDLAEAEENGNNSDDNDNDDDDDDDYVAVAAAMPTSVVKKGKTQTGSARKHGKSTKAKSEAGGNDAITTTITAINEDDDDVAITPPPLKVKKKKLRRKSSALMSQSQQSAVVDTQQQPSSSSLCSTQESGFSVLKEVWADTTFFIRDKRPLSSNNSNAIVSSEHYTAFPDDERHALLRVDELRDAGLWPGVTSTVPPRLQSHLPPSQQQQQQQQQPQQQKTHWDYLLAEMEWLARDFQEERRRKASAAKRAVKACAKRVKDKTARAERRRRERESGLKRIAAFTARIVKRFWGDVGKIAEYKLKVRLDAEKSQAMTKHLDFMVGQTERLSQQIALDLRTNNNSSNNGSTADDNSNNNNNNNTQKMEEEEEEEEDNNINSVKSNISSSSNNNNASNNISNVSEEDMTAAGAITSREKIERAAEEALAAQPTGATLATTHVRTPVPFLLRGTLREYQHVGLDWLVTMYEKHLNVILADDMGLGKTIMTISLLAHLAGERGVWGPHLIVVPASTVMNWELELRKWCPALKVLTYVGTPKERRARRAGWARENALHVCVTSYRIALQDAPLLRRRRWCYMILDEAQNIKNFRSQRWQVLLQYRSERRLLLTGTPLQNSVMELWSLMHFLMPAVFASHAEFAEWFAVPLTALAENGSNSDVSASAAAAADSGLVARLHAVLRPFILRRVKRVVEHDLPPKREVLVTCSLSRRQQLLYEEFIGAASTQETLASGSFFGVVNVLMQLRKVCNHPDLFAPRPTDSPFVLPAHAAAVTAGGGGSGNGAAYVRIPAAVANITGCFGCENGGCGRVPSWARLDTSESFFGVRDTAVLGLAQAKTFAALAAERKQSFERDFSARNNSGGGSEKSFMDSFAWERRRLAVEEDVACLTHYANVARNTALWRPGSSAALKEVLTVRKKSPFVVPLERRVEEWSALAPHYLFLHPRVTAPPPALALSHGWAPLVEPQRRRNELVARALEPVRALFEPIDIRLQMHFPDKRLLQYDCGKLQALHPLLTKLRDDGHKVVLFTRKKKLISI